MNLAWLHSFRRVAETQSFSRAADSLFLTQPAVSQHVRQLERFFGHKLLTQTGRQLQLTDAGRKVYELACRLERDIADVREGLEHLESQARGLVTIASPPTPLALYLPRVLRHFWAVYPGVSVRTLSRVRDQVTTAVAHGVADIGLQTAPFLHPALVTRLLLKDRLVAVCAPTHPLAAQRAVAPETLRRVKVAQLPPGAESRTLVDDWFAARGVHLDDRLELSSLEEIRAAALHNLAVGFLSEGYVRADLAGGRLARLDLAGFDLVRWLYAIHRPDIGPVASDFVAVMTRLAAGIGPRSA
jgi:DNA-binding transcriptional LysR family regulator